MTKKATKIENDRPNLRLIKTADIAEKTNTSENKRTKNPLVAQLTELADKIDLEIKRILEE